MALKTRPALQESQGRSLPWGGSRLVNAYAEMSQGDASDQFAVMVVPGLTIFKELTSQEIRGMHRMGTTLYAVTGGLLYSVASDGTAVGLGVVGGTGPVRMVDNGTQMAIASNDTVGYVYSGGVLYSGILNLPPVSDVAYIDSYFVWAAAGSDQFIISAPGDGLTYDALDVATVEGDPDAIVGVINDHRELHFYGSDTVEIWYNSGNADFPFERQGNAFIERGCIDRDSIVKVDNSVFFMGDDRIVYRLNGYTPQRMSTHAIEYRIAGAAWFRAFTYTQEGHKFYVLNTDVGSFALDMATNLWAERKSFGASNYRVGCAEVCYGQTIMGGNMVGTLWTPSLDVFTENSDPIIVTIGLPSLERDRDRVTLYMIELYCETGVGNSADPDPQAVMRYSRDGGRTWSNDMARTLGAIGEYTTRAVWRPNVQFRSLEIEFVLASKTRRFVLGYYLDAR